MNVELTWPDKERSLAVADEPSCHRLVLDRRRSRPSTPSPDPQQVGQRFIEGDNLDAMKLLLAEGARARLIYLDPPYNTGNGFVYRDDFGDGHVDWLTMMAPRLRLAHRLLTDDGVVVVSIDAGEVHHAALLLDEIFGEQNRLNALAWVSNPKGRQLTAGGPVGTHEYLLLYARTARLVDQFKAPLERLHAVMPAIYRKVSYPQGNDERGAYLLKNRLHNSNSRFHEGNSPSMVYRIHHHPVTGEVKITDIDDDTSFEGFDTALPHPNARADRQWHAWRWSRSRVLRDHHELEFVHDQGELTIWTKVRDLDRTAIKSAVLGPSTVTAQADLTDLGLGRIFETPKPVALLQLLVAAVTHGDDLLIDPFAGSASLAHAVAAQNADDGARRRVISINTAEPTAAHSPARAAGYQTVAEIGVARINAALAHLPGVSATLLVQRVSPYAR